MLAPLTGPLAIFIGSLVHGFVAHTPRDEPFSFAAVLVLLFAFYVFGAPLSYAAMLILSWPLIVLTDTARGWWIACAVGALTGAALFPAYLHLLDPHGSFEFFPGAGLFAGGTVAVVFWLIAIRGRAATAS